MTSNAHFSGGTGQNLDRNLKAKLKPLSYRVKRSISGKSPSRQSKSTERKLDLAAKLRLEPKSVKTMNAYFGLVQRRKSTKGQREHKQETKQETLKDKNLKKSARPVATDHLVSHNQNGKTAIEHIATDSLPVPQITTSVKREPHPVLMLPGVVQ